MSKVHVTIGVERRVSAERLRDEVLEALSLIEGIEWARAHVGFAGDSKTRRYALEKLFNGVQPEDYAKACKSKGRKP